MYTNSASFCLDVPRRGLPATQNLQRKMILPVGGVKAWKDVCCGFCKRKIVLSSTRAFVAWAQLVKKSFPSLRARKEFVLPRRKTFLRMWLVESNDRNNFLCVLRKRKTKVHYWRCVRLHDECLAVARPEASHRIA